MNQKKAVRFKHFSEGCPECKGLGVITTFYGGGVYESTKDCERCVGRGEVGNCALCQGTGVADETQCPDCRGVGATGDCADCAGTGAIEAGECPACAGFGFIQST